VTPEYAKEAEAESDHHLHLRAVGRRDPELRRISLARPSRAMRAGNSARNQW
jgi:hypothetical protein